MALVITVNSINIAYMGFSIIEYWLQLIGSYCNVIVGLSRDDSGPTMTFCNQRVTCCDVFAISLITMSQSGKFLLGSVHERTTSSPAIPPPQINTSAHGFPTTQHRSQSAFARSRQVRRVELRPQAPPMVDLIPQDSTEDAKSKQSSSNDWRVQVSADNEIRVASMTDEEREAAKREVIERFGVGVGDVLKRARQAREKTATKGWLGHKHRSPPPSSEADKEAFQKMPEGAVLYKMYHPRKLTLLGLS